MNKAWPVLRRAVDGSLSILYPVRCIVCGEVQPYGEADFVCDRCKAHLPAVPKRTCGKCGRGIQYADEICSDCKGEAFAFVRGYVLYPYTDAVSAMLLRYKGGGHTSAAKGIAFLLAARFPLDGLPDIDCMMPVPSNRAKDRRRGFNHTKLLVRRLAALYGLPVDCDALYAARHTKKQSGLSAGERRLNVKGAYAVRNAAAVAGKTILLFDDVFTTGSTMNACAEALMEAGARVVYVMAVAASVREPRG